MCVYGARRMTTRRARAELENRIRVGLSRAYESARLWLIKTNLGILIGDSEQISIRVWVERKMSDAFRIAINSPSDPFVGL